MKILVTCWRDSRHPQGGGSERYLERVAEYLAARGHEAIFATSRAPGQRHRERIGGVSLWRRGGKFTCYPAVLLAVAAGRLGIGPFAGVDAAVDTQNGIPFFVRCTGIPTVLLTHHCHRSQWPVAGPLVARLGWFLESRVSPLVHRGCPYVTVSEPSRDELVRLGVDPGAITIVRNGIDPAPSAAELPALPPDGRAHLITLSRLVPHKQIEHAVDAVVALADRGFEVTLDIVGSGWWEGELRRYVDKRGAGALVTFHGHVDELLKHALLSRAAVHLMPSRKEGWGLAVIEAAQHGVPTIGYASSGGLRDSIVDGATGILAADEKGFIDAACSLVSDPGRARRLGESARAAARRYSWADTGAAFEELLGRLARGRGPRR